MSPNRSGGHADRRKRGFCRHPDAPMASIRASPPPRRRKAKRPTLHLGSPLKMRPAYLTVMKLAAIRQRILSARRNANATIVIVGISLPTVGKTELPATKRLEGTSKNRIAVGTHIAMRPTGSPEAVARLRFPQNVASGFPAPRSSAIGSQHREALQRPIGKMQFGSR